MRKSEGVEKGGNWDFEKMYSPFLSDLGHHWTPRPQR